MQLLRTRYLETQLSPAATGVELRTLGAHLCALCAISAISFALHALMVLSLLPYAFGEHKFLLVAALASLIGVTVAAQRTLAALPKAAPVSAAPTRFGPRD